MNLIIITGVSGSGKSTALKAFEDLGFLAIDNFPVRLLLPYLEEVKESLNEAKIALVMDIRDKHFLEEYSKVFNLLRERGLNFEVLFLDAQEEVIISRYNQTKRVHPLMKENQFNSLVEAIKEEKRLLLPLKELSNLVIDTSYFNLHQLRNEIFKFYKNRGNLGKLVIHLVAFGYKYGIPYEANYLFDVRFLPNPYFNPELKSLNGTFEKVKGFLLSFVETRQFLERFMEFIKFVLPFHIKEGRKFLVIGIGCTGGRHRSVALVEILKEEILSNLSEVEVVSSYRDIDKDV
ncbi:MAG: RNase adapter RapZ [Thermodesulfobacteriaceae bacterium]|nr:RNase adapter RapZ [Thermodesulfobacteriaceae bacterium]MCX8041951.1 RNase adapter RapZ [Thermodesulfobacteriaceae bacterium]MDW8136242.1 RNase adapter RapZ [Thermodesulfobacterium sp.]